MAARLIAISLFDYTWRWQHGWQIKCMRNLGPTIFWPEPKKAGEWLPLFCIVFICNELEDYALEWWAAEKKLAAFFMLAHNPELLACETKDWNCFMLLACWRRDITLRQIMIIILLLRSVMTQLTDWILTLLKNLFHYLAAFPTHCLIVFYNFTHCLTQLATRETIIPGVTSCLKRSNIVDQI